MDTVSLDFTTAFDKVNYKIVLDEVEKQEINVNYVDGSRSF